MQYVTILVSVLLGACAQVLLKLGTIKAGSFALLKLFTNPYTLGGLVLYGLSALLWIVALSKVQLSYAYPMVSLGYVIVFGLSYWIFDEPISLLRAGGLVLIVLGVLMIAKS
ncbi:cation/cationic drug transporter [Paenibacillus sp. N4]|uniref:cation/cationic drug transporter n=1 Tax=Paenibacillus vietnamensis TaxID=2590547 RepID=UPI001CD10F48|nr:cation/cationic drug transporter [Paenibacillus vietnamensis]MCA0755147.1 cation/cationic drug transporter [Paenibacillus vietnamensis]